MRKIRIFFGILLIYLIAIIHIYYDLLNYFSDSLFICFSIGFILTSCLYYYLRFKRLHIEIKLLQRVSENSSLKLIGIIGSNPQPVNYLNKHYDYLSVPVANEAKKKLRTMLFPNLNDLNSIDIDPTENEMNCIINGLDESFKKIRPGISDNFWIWRTKKLIEFFLKTNNVVVPYISTEADCKMIHDLGGLVVVVSSNSDPKTVLPYDYQIINDRSLYDLHRVIDHFLLEHNLE